MSSTSTSSSEFYSSSDSDEDIEIQLRPKNVNYVEYTVPQYSDEVFQEHFRVSRKVLFDLINKFEQSRLYNEYHSGCWGKFNAEYHLLTFLWFAGHQTASFRDVADRFDMSISSLFRIIRRVTTFLSELAATEIVWPSNTERNEIEQHFREQGFPGVVGVIDGSHIKIDKPGDDPDSYLNRKHDYSIHIQAVCDYNKKIRDVFIGFPGSVHDSRVFRVSPLSRQLEANCGLDRYVLGDSGYPCTRYLLTPYRDRGNLTRAQQHYNTVLSKHRYVIEHCFGLLKQKFRQLYFIKLKKIEDICHFIRACCVLHNLAIDDKFEYNEDEVRNYVQNDNQELPHIEGDGDRDDADGIQMRNHICHILFQGR